MEIIIYAAYRGAARDAPEQTYYSLEKPEFHSGFSVYINASEYILPDGYSVVSGLKLLSPAGKTCQLGGGQQPLLIDPDIIGQGRSIALKKVRDITMNVLMEELLKEEGYANDHT